MKRRFRASLVALGLALVPAAAQGVACTLPDLAARVTARVGPSASEFARMAARDAVVTDPDLARAYSCIERTLQGRTESAFPEAIGYRSWRTDGDIHLFPGNDYSFGRVFVSEQARAYFDVSAGPFGTGALIVKETFTIDSHGLVLAGESFLFRRAGPRGWEGAHLRIGGQVSRDFAPCASCHRMAENDHGLFGPNWLRGTRTLTPSRAPR